MTVFDRGSTNNIDDPPDVVDMTKGSDHQHDNGEVEVPVEIKEQQKAMHPIVWNLMLLSGVIIYGSYTIFVHLCEVDGKLPFSSFSVILLIEVSKLSISLCLIPAHLRMSFFNMYRKCSPSVIISPMIVPAILYAFNNNLGVHMQLEMDPVSYQLCICIGFLVPVYLDGALELPTFRMSLPFAVPAVLYCLNNNISVHMQVEMDPATYQVLGNLKIFSTALLYRAIINRPISPVQWVSLVILACAGAANSFGGFHAKGVAVSASQIHISVKGLYMVSLYCFISGLAGVYSEYILKKRYETSIHIQNAMLYIYGVFLNGSVFAYGALRSDDPDAWNLIKGYSSYTWMVVATQAVSGLIMSAIMKHGNNITRLFLIACAMLVTTVLSMLVFGLQLNFYFCLAFMLVIGALILYHDVLSYSTVKLYFNRFLLGKSL